MQNIYRIISRFCLSCLDLLVFLFPKTFNLFGIQKFSAAPAYRVYISQLLRYSCYSIFSFMCMFCRSLFVLLYFLRLALWYLQTLLDFERTWWRLFQKHVLRTKYDIYVFIAIEFSGFLNNGPQFNMLRSAVCGNMF